MKNTLKILILILTLVSCKREINEKTEKLESDFNLKKDYSQLTNKMTEMDTIKVWMDLSLCMNPGIEKLTITREKDSLKIQPEFAVSMVEKLEFIKQKTIRISINDTVWKLNEFLKRNEKRVKSDSSKYGRFQITHNAEKLNYFTDGLGDSAEFLIDYCATMKRLIPESEYHIYREIEEIE